MHIPAARQLNLEQQASHAQVALLQGKYEGQLSRAGVCGDGTGPGVSPMLEHEPAAHASVMQARA